MGQGEVRARDRGRQRYRFLDFLEERHLNHHYMIKSCFAISCDSCSFLFAEITSTCTGAHVLGRRCLPVPNSRCRGEISSQILTRGKHKRGDRTWRQACPAWAERAVEVWSGEGLSPNPRPRRGQIFGIGRYDGGCRVARSVGPWHDPGGMRFLPRPRWSPPPVTASVPCPSQTLDGAPRSPAVPLSRCLAYGPCSVDQDTPQTIDCPEGGAEARSDTPRGNRDISGVFRAPRGRPRSAGCLRAGLLAVLDGLGGDGGGTWRESDPGLGGLLLLGSNGRGHLMVPRVGDIHDS